MCGCFQGSPGYIIVLPSSVHHLPFKRAKGSFMFNAFHLSLHFRQKSDLFTSAKKIPRKIFVFFFFLGKSFPSRIVRLMHDGSFIHVSFHSFPNISNFQIDICAVWKRCRPKDSVYSFPEDECTVHSELMIMINVFHCHGTKRLLLSPMW